MTSRQPALSDLEEEVMRVVWDTGSCTAEDVRQALEPQRLLKDSTVRTLLRRMEEKGFVGHRIEGRTYVYYPHLRPEAAAARAVRQIVDRFCGGSVETLLLGMVDDRMLETDDLAQLADLIAASEAQAGGDR